MSLEVFSRHHIILTILDNIIRNARSVEDVIKLHNINYFHDYIPIGFMTSVWEIDKSLIPACSIMFFNIWKDIIKHSGNVGFINMYLLKNKNKFEIIYNKDPFKFAQSEQYFGPYSSTILYCSRCGIHSETIHRNIQIRRGDECLMACTMCTACGYRQFY
jgi:DNA-directed RNA polymerase subunit M/transcription elongation factor TFIIS